MTTQLKGVALNDKFREHLAAIITGVTGKPITKSNAYKIFRDMMRGAALFAYKEGVVEQGKLSLSGIGTFNIRKGKARSPVRDGEVIHSPKEQWEFVPRFRWRPSTRIEADLAALFGFDGDPAKVEMLGLYAEGYKPSIFPDETEAPALDDAPTTDPDMAVDADTEPAPAPEPTPEPAPEPEPTPAPETKPTEL